MKTSNRNSPHLRAKDRRLLKALANMPKTVSMLEKNNIAIDRLDEDLEVAKINPESRKQKVVSSGIII